MNAHLYLRASTKDQDANRAKESLEAFAAEKSSPLQAFTPRTSVGRSSTALN